MLVRNDGFTLEDEVKSLMSLLLEENNTREKDTGTTDTHSKTVMNQGTE